MATAYVGGDMSRQNDKSAENSARQQRLSQALKANLRRRKDQARQRQDTARDTDEQDTGSGHRDRSGGESA